MKKVLMTAGGPFLPIRQGSDRLIRDVAHYLNGLPNVELTLAIVGNPSPNAENAYADVCSRVVWLRRSGRWSVLGWFNKLCARCGVTVFESVGLALGMRRQLTKLAKDADVVLMNYVCWFAMLPKFIRRAKTICLTIDLMYYRRASMIGNRTLRERICVALTRYFELKLFRTFRKIVVLGEYERELLRNLGYPLDHVLKIGMPIEARKAESKVKKYDFITVSGAAKPNVDGVLIFLRRIAPLLSPRKITYALVGPICKAGEIEKIGVENRCTAEGAILLGNVELVRLGYVEDLAEACAESRIGVAIVPVGSGIKVKCVELMLRGLPVITTDHGVEGIPATPEGHINIDHETDDEIRSRLLSWLDRSEMTECVGESQRKQVAEEFAAENALHSLVQEIVSNTSPKECSRNLTIGYATTVDYGGLRNYIQPETYPKVKVYSFNTLVGKLLSRIGRFVAKDAIARFLTYDARFFYYGGVARKPIDILHLWNGISMLPRPWVSTFEDTMPRSAAALSLMRDESNKTIPFGVHFLASRHCKKLIAMSQSAVNRTMLALRNCPEEQRTVIRNKITVLHPPQPIACENTARFVNIGTVHFVFIGASFWRKGGEESFEVMRRLHHEGLDVELSIVSLMESEEWASHHILKKDVEAMREAFDAEKKWCHYYERLPNAGVLQLLTHAHVLLLPTHQDTYGYSVLEGQACGCPAITTDVFAMSEINDNDCGWVINVPKDCSGNAYYSTEDEANALVATIESGLEQIVREIVADKSILKTKSVRALARIRKEHDPKMHAEQLKEIYASI